MRSCFRISCSVLLLMTITTSTAAQSEPFALGQCASRFPDVAGLEDGGFVAVWVEDAQIPDSEFFGRVIWGQIFAADGLPRSPRMRLAPTAEEPFAVRVAPANDGGFVIAFREDDRLRLVHFTPDQAGGSDSVLGPWNRAHPALAAGDDDFLSLVSTQDENEFQVIRFLPSGSVTSTGTLRREENVSLRGFAATVLADGDSAIAYQVFPPPMPAQIPIANETRPLRLQRFSAAGVPVGEPRRLAENAAHADLAARPDGGLVLVYLEATESGSTRLIAEVLDAGLETVERIQVKKIETFPSPVVSVSPNGETFTIVWRELIQTPPSTPRDPRNRLVARTFDVDGTLRGSLTLATDLVAEGGVAPNRAFLPRLTHLDSGRIAGAWWHQAEPPLDRPADACSVSEGAFVRTVDPLPPCPEGTLCLQEDRFAVSVAWTDPRTGNSGVGSPIPVTDDTGTFWFFQAENLELMVKVLDARAVNGHFWVFFGSLTDVEFELIVTDLLTGDSRSYTNPPFEMAGRADTLAFDGTP